LEESIFSLDALDHQADAGDVARARVLLDDLTDPAALLVFADRDCPACPYLVRAVAALAAANPHISTTVVDVGRQAALADHYEIRAVPTTIVDGELTLVGVRSVDELARLILERHGPGGERIDFRSLVDAGRLDAAAGHLLERRGVGAFAELWDQSNLERRIALMLVAEMTLDQDPRALDAMVPLLISVLLRDRATEGNPSLRGDTAALLAMTGHADARAAVESLLTDPHPEVARAAKDALVDMNHKR